MSLPRCKCTEQEVSLLCENEKCQGLFLCEKCFESSHQGKEHKKTKITDWLNSKFGAELETALKEDYQNLSKRYNEAKAHLISKENEIQELQAKLPQIFRLISSYVLEQIKCVLEKALYMLKVNWTRMMDSDALLKKELECMLSPASMLLSICESLENSRNLGILVNGINKKSISLDTLLRGKKEYIENELKVLTHSIQSVSHQKFTERAKGLAMKSLETCFENIQESIIQESDLEMQIKSIRNRHQKITIPSALNSPNSSRASDFLKSPALSNISRSSFFKKQNSGIFSEIKDISDLADAKVPSFLSSLSNKTITEGHEYREEREEEKTMTPSESKGKPKPMMLSMLSKTPNRIGRTLQKPLFGLSFKNQNGLKGQEAPRANSNGTSFRKTIDNLRQESQRDDEDSSGFSSSGSKQSAFLTNSKLAKSCILNTKDSAVSFRNILDPSTPTTKTMSIIPTMGDEYDERNPDEKTLEEIKEEASFSNAFSRKSLDLSFSVLVYSALDREVVKIGRNGFVQGSPVQVEENEGELKCVLFLAEEEDEIDMGSPQSNFSDFANAGSSQSLLAVAFEPLNEPENAIKIFDLKENQTLFTEKHAHSKSINALEGVKYNLKKKTFQFVSCAFDRVLRHWLYNDNTRTLKLLSEFKHDDFGVFICLFRPTPRQNGYNLICAGIENKIACFFVRETEMEMKKRVDQAHLRKISCICMFNDLSFVTGGADGLIKIWSYENLACVETLDNRQPVFSLAVISPEVLVSTANDPKMKLFSINIWSCRHKELIQSVIGSHNSRIFCLKKTSPWTFVSIDKSKFIFSWKLSFNSTSGFPQINAHIDSSGCQRKNGSHNRIKKELKKPPQKTNEVISKN